MKKNRILILLLGLLLLLTGCNSGKEGVVATVDGEDIEEYKFNFYYYIQRSQVVGFAGEEALEQGQEHDEFGRSFGEVLRTNILDNLIQNQAIINEAKEEGIDVEDQVQEQMTAQKEANGEEFFNSMLEDMGLSEEEYEDLVRDNLYVTEFANQKLEEIEVTDEEIEKYYEENKDQLKQVDSRHILVETEEEAEQVLERLENGEDFEELAKELSLDTGSAEKGGNLGFASKGTMVAEFDEFLFSAEKGEISDPIETEYGFHIIEILDISDSLEDSKESIEQTLTLEKYQDLVDKLVKDAKVKKHINLEEEPEAVQEKAQEDKAKQEAAQEEAQSQGEEKSDQNEEAQETDQSTEAEEATEGSEENTEESKQASDEDQDN